MLLRLFHNRMESRVTRLLSTMTEWFISVPCCFMQGQMMSTSAASRGITLTAFQSQENGLRIAPVVSFGLAAPRSAGALLCI